MSEDKTSSDGSPGWDAIQQVVDRFYPGQEPLHYAPKLPAALGGDDPLDGISAYRAEGPPSHWHLVTFGLSELYAKESDDAEQSGFGFEMTFRLARAEGEEHPPYWALSMLQNVARYVFSTGNTFDEGHQLPFNGPIALGSDTLIHAATFVLDPQLGEIDTPNGHLRLLQMVGITLDESAAIRRWNHAGVMKLLSEGNPLLVTSLARRSILENPDHARLVAERAAAEGSSSDTTYVTQLAYEQQGERVRMQLGANSVESVRALLAGRIPFGRGYTIFGGEQVVLCRATDAPRASIEEGLLRLDLTAPLALEMHQKLAPQRGIYRFDGLPSFEIEVVPTPIKDPGGKVISTVGLGLREPHPPRPLSSTWRGGAQSQKPRPWASLPPPLHVLERGRGVRLTQPRPRSRVLRPAFRRIGRPCARWSGACW